MNELECTPAQVRDELQSEAPPRLVDVREASEWDLVHLEGGRLLDQALLDVMLRDWNKDEQIICYCHHGVRSVQAALYLRQQGFSSVRSMKGGIDAWAREIDPSLPRY
ncbi:MAG: rhodanese-like domain-containing protein [SAR324 cluster bacterium]|nr:rhodanese-like domain-containing protein [SAR324 cluster bacterium]